MKFVILLILILNGQGLSAQINEMQFLGKTWYLHGIDFRITNKVHDNGFYQNMINQLHYPNKEYRDFLLHRNATWQRNYKVAPLNGFSAGLVFRPFHYHKWKFIRQIELSHNLELERLNIIGEIPYPSNTSILIRSANIGYSPRVILSSPTVGGILKFYLSGDLYGYLPIRGYVYTNPPDALLTSKADSYTRQEKNYKDRLKNENAKGGVGVSLGLKLNVSCLWNFHIESNYGLYSTFNKNPKSYHPSTYLGLQFGLRYKFSVRDENEEKPGDKKPSVFW